MSCFETTAAITRVRTPDRHNPRTALSKSGAAAYSKQTGIPTHYHYLYNYITLVKSVLVLFLFDNFLFF